jgi:photosystem II stability/assembly factor-like uncharacterized protein
MEKLAGRLTRLSPRSRRAIGWMAVASVVVVVAGVYYVRPNPNAHPAATLAARQPYPVERTGDFIRYQFSSPTLGWATDVPGSTPLGDAGSFWIFKTDDAARHWHVELLGRTANLSATLESLQFVDPRDGFVVAGEPLSLFRTTDAGAQWTKTDLPTPDVELVQFVDPNHGWAEAVTKNVPNRQVHLFQSRDGGRSWTVLRDPPSSASPFPVFLSPTEGWSPTHDPQRGYVFRTTDGGDTWDRRDLPPGAVGSDVFTVVRARPGGGVEADVFSQSSPSPPMIYATFDHGGAWTAVTVPVPGDGTPIQCMDSTQCWIAEGAVLYKTTDGGQSWKPFAQVDAGLELTNVLDSRDAWGLVHLAYGTGLVSTTDGGKTWKPVGAPVPGQTP